MNTTPVPRESVRIHVHSGLRFLYDDPKAPFRELEVRIEFIDPLELSVSADRIEFVLLPATDQMQIELLRSLRRKCCMTCIVAVVNDMTGHQTYQAMSSGATCVFNLAILVDKQLDLLHTVLRAHVGAAARPVRLASTEPRIPQQPASLAQCLDEENRLLIDLLCGPHTISSIAKRFYCSERSMYRRVRRVYESFGVSSRNELRSAVAVSHVGAPDDP
ncbi:MAG: helix-turn-helix transcriptional regulator [Pseudonocardiaceae bacterium]